jgi:6-phospho-3-hexuloisomerase
MDDASSRYAAKKNLVLDELALALGSIKDSDIEHLKNELLKADRVFFVGIGRVMLALQCIAKRMSHVGIHTHCIGEITEPAITDKDILIAASGSGSSIIPLAIAKKAKALGARVAYLGSNPKSPLSKTADFTVRIPVKTKLNLKGEIPSVQPMTSLFEQTLLLFGDILAQLIIEERHIDIDELWKYHANLE